MHSDPSLGPGSSSSSSAILRNAPFLKPVLHTLAVLQQPNRHPRHERYRVYIQLGSFLCCLVLHISWLYSTLLSWLIGLLVQLGVVVATSFTLFIVMEYSDRSSDAAEVERLIRPLLEVQLWTRWCQLLHALLLREWWFAWCFLAPQIPLDWHLASKGYLRPDATTLWKTVKHLDRWNKIKLLYQCVVFVVQLVLMVMAMISLLFSNGH